ncbi:MAG: response regulator [Bacteroidota bacterium]
MMTCWLIDDNEIDLLITRKLLQIWEPSLSTEEFTNGRRVINQLKLPNCEPPQFIFLDLFMPEFSGWEFLDEYQHFEKSFTQIYVLSSSVDRIDIDRARSYEAVKGYISKPITQEGIRRAMANYQQQLVED